MTEYCDLCRQLMKIALKFQHVIMSIIVNVLYLNFHQELNVAHIVSDDLHTSVKVL